MICENCKRGSGCGYEPEIRGGEESCPGYQAIFPDADKMPYTPQYVGTLCTEDNPCDQCRRARESAIKKTADRVDRRRDIEFNRLRDRIKSFGEGSYISEYHYPEADPKNRVYEIHVEAPDGPIDIGISIYPRESVHRLINYALDGISAAYPDNFEGEGRGL